MIAGSIEIQLMADMVRLQADMDAANRSVSGAMGGIEKSVGSAKAAIVAMGKISDQLDALKGSISSLAQGFDRGEKSAGVFSRTMAETRRLLGITAAAADETAKSFAGIEVPESVFASLETWQEKSAAALGAGAAVGWQKAKDAWEDFKSWGERQVVIWGVALTVGISAAVLGAVYAAFKAASFAIGLLTGESYKSANIDALAKINSEVKSLQELLPLTATGASALNQALKDQGISAKDYADTLGSVRIAAQSNGEELDRLGVKYKNQNGGLLTTREALLSAAAVLATYTKGWDRNQAASAIGMGSEKQIQDALAITAIKTQEAKDRMVDYGLVIGEGTQEQVKKYEEAMQGFAKESELTSQGFSRAVADNIMPILTDLATFFRDGFPSAVMAFRYSMATVTSLFYGLKTAVYIATESIVASISAVGSVIAGLGSAAYRALTGDFEGAKNALTSGWADAKSRLDNAGAGMVAQARNNSAAIALAWGADSLGAASAADAVEKTGKAWEKASVVVKGNQDMLKAYEALAKEIRQKVAEQELEVAGGQKATESDKLRIKFVELLGSTLKGLGITQQVEIDAYIHRLKLTEEQLKQSKRLQAAYAAEIESQNEVNAAYVAASKAREQVRLSIDAYAQSVKEATDLIAIEQAMAGRSDRDRAAAIAQYQIALELKKKINEIDSNAGLESEAQREELRAKARLAALQAGLNAEARATLDAAKKMSDELDRIISDGLMRGFENGKGFAENFRDTLVNTFKTMVLQPTISAIVRPVGSAVSNAVYGGGAGGSMMGNMLLNSAGSMGGLFASNAAYGAAIGTTSIGAGSQAAMLAAQTGEFGAAGVAATSSAAAGAGTGAMATMSAAMPYVAAAVAIYALMNAHGEYVKNMGEGTLLGDAQGKGAMVGGGRFGDAPKGTVDLLQGLQTSYMTAAASLGVTTGQTHFAYGSNNSDGGKFSIAGGVQGRDLYNSGEQLTSPEALSIAASRAVFTALQESDLPTYLAGIFDGMNASAMTQDQINAAMAYAQQIKGLHDQFELMPFENLRDLSLSATQALIGFSGGIDKLGANLQGYYTNFYSAEEQRAQAVKNINAATVGSGLDAATATRESFRAIVDAQDLTTTSGQKMYAALMAVSGAFAQVTPAAEATSKTLADAVKALSDAAKTAASSALDGLSKAIDAEKGGLNTQLNSIISSVGKLQTLASSLKSTLDGLRISGSDAAYRADAQAQISAALAMARSGGGLPLDGQLTSALATVSKPSEQLFSTFEDYARDFYKTANDIASLNDLTGVQLTAEQRQQRALEDQIKGLDAILANAKLQLDAANGINTSVLSVADALNAFAAALASVTGTGAAASASSAAMAAASSAPSVLDTVAAYGQANKDKPGDPYYFMAGANDYAAKASAWGNLASLSGTNVADMVDGSGHGLAYWAEAQRQFDAGMAPTTQSIQGFASGGSFGGGLRLVGENGPELEVTGPSRIWNADQTRSMLQSGGADNTELLAELKLLREEVRGLRSSAERGNENTQRTADTLNGRQGVAFLVEIAK